MNKNEIEGATQKGVGAIKDALGKATGNTKLQAEGVVDKVSGSAKEAMGKAEQAVHNLAENAKK